MRRSYCHERSLEFVNETEVAIDHEKFRDDYVEFFLRVKQRLDVRVTQTVAAGVLYLFNHDVWGRSQDFKSLLEQR